MDSEFEVPERKIAEIRQKAARRVLQGFFLDKRYYVAPKVTKILQEKLKAKLISHLSQTIGELKHQLAETHHQKMVTIEIEIKGKIGQLTEHVSESSLSEFKQWFNTMLAEKSKDFKGNDSVWLDIIKPALMVFLGLVITFLTAPLRPFFSTVALFANSFFVQSDSIGLKMFQKAIANNQKVAEEEFPKTFNAILKLGVKPSSSV